MVLGTWQRESVPAMKLACLLALLASTHMGRSCLLEIEWQGGRWYDNRKMLRGQQTPVSNETRLATGVSDRIDGEKVAQRDLGPQKNASIKIVLNFGEACSDIAGLAREFGLETVEFPFKTDESRTFSGPGSLAMTVRSGLFSRPICMRASAEIANNLLFFVADLL